MKNLIVILFVAFALCGCKKTEIQQKPVGTLITIDVIPTSFNDQAKSRVETTEGVFVIVGITSGIKGEPVSLISKTNCSSFYLCIGDNKKGHRVRF